MTEQVLIPQRITTVSAKNLLSNAREHYRCRDTRATKEDVLARFGAHLASLGWKSHHIKITDVHTELEDAVTQQIRNRMIRPRS